MITIYHLSNTVNDYENCNGNNSDKKDDNHYIFDIWNINDTDDKI